MPHALANRLAQRALENIPSDDIISVFVNGGSERLLKSFSRRLGYLHNCDIAIKIAETWLSEGGLIGDVIKLNDLGINLLCNVAPVTPKATLAAIERAANSEDGQHFTSRKNNHFTKYTRLLRSLAYDGELFERCVNLICRFALSEDPEENHNSIRDLLRSLFYIYLSGTHASVGQRLRIIDRLVSSKIEYEQALGLHLLGAALEAWHFSSSYGFDFGARSRDYGYAPKTSDEIHKWYTEFIDLTETVAISNKPIAAKVKALLADQFRGLWIKAGVFDELERVANLIASKGTWNEGWIAVRTTIRFDSKKMEPDLLERLRQLEQLLAPENLIEQARTYAFSTHRHSMGLADITEENESASVQYERVERTTRSIGREVARNETIFELLLPEIVSVDGARLYSFGQGLAEGCVDPLSMWQDFRQQLETIDDDKRNYQAVCGFLRKISENDRELCEKILNDALTDDIFGARFPLLQMSVEIDERGVQRIAQSLTEGVAPTWIYRNLAYGRTHESINDENLANLLQIIASKPDGLDIAIDILHMRLYANKSEKREHSETLISFGKELLGQLTFERERNRQADMDLELSEIVHACLSDENSVATAKILSKNIAKALSEYKVYPMEYTHFLGSLARNQPLVFLDEFLGNYEVYKTRIFTDDFEHGRNPLSEIEDDIIISWCKIDPSDRYPLVAASIVAYRHSEIDKKLEWTPIALTIIDNAPDTVALLNELKGTFRPMSWNDSLADMMRKRISLIIDLKNHKNPLVREWAYNEERVFVEEINSERQREEERNRSRDERFE